MSKRSSDTVWQSTGASYPALSQDALHYDVVVVGGGITGLTAALALKQAGKKVAVVEQRSIASGTTGCSSAHLSTQFDADYHQVCKTFGADAASQIRQAMADAIDHIQMRCRELGIRCGFERIPGYYFADQGQKTEDVDAEFQAARKAGLDVEMLDELPLPWATQKGFRVDNQAVFDPVRYCEGLAQAIYGDGCIIFTDTRVLDVSDGSPCTVQTMRGKLTADAVLMATHTPLGRSILHTMLEPMMSYILLCRVEAEVPHGLFWDVDEPYHYLRPITRDGETLLLVGGADNKTGKTIQNHPYERLERYTRERFGRTEVLQQWSAQFFSPADHMPFIGCLPSMHSIYTSTGYDGDGLTLGTAGGLAVAHCILEGTDPLAQLCTPLRIKGKALPKITRMNLDVMGHLVRDRLKQEELEALDRLIPGQGKIVRVDGKALAFSRAKNGELIHTGAVCPHLGCLVHWNELEQTWDCPCHGSRFTPEGCRFEGPARADLGHDEPPGGPNSDSGHA